MHKLAIISNVIQKCCTKIAEQGIEPVGLAKSNDKLVEVNQSVYKNTNTSDNTRMLLKIIISINTIITRKYLCVTPSPLRSSKAPGVKFKACP